MYLTNLVRIASRCHCWRSQNRLQNRLYLHQLDRKQHRRQSSDPAYSFTTTGNRSLVANFIALPRITIGSSAPGTITIVWPEGAFTAGWLLQESPNLVQGSCIESLRPYTIVGTQRQVTITNPTGALFFRLKYP